MKTYLTVAAFEADLESADLTFTPGTFASVSSGFVFLGNYQNGPLIVVKVVLS